MTVAFTVTGLGFTLGNMLLARSLPVEQYAIFALVTAMLQIAMLVGPAGLDRVLARRTVAVRPLRARLWATTLLTAGGAALVGAAGYSLPPVLPVVLAVGVVGGSLTTLAAAYYQGRQEFRTSLLLNQSQNLVLLLTGALAVALAVRQAWVPCALLALGQGVAAVIGWRGMRRGPEPVAPGPTVPWSEGLSLIGVHSATLLLVQLERLLIPKVLPIEALGTFAVLAATAGAPFRMLQLGVGYTMIPRLRAAPSVADRRLVIAKEAAAVGGVMLAAGIAVWLLTDPVVDWFTQAKYHIDRALLLAALASGTFKVLGAFSTSAVSSLADTRDLTYLTVIGWVSVGLAIGAAAIGARWGLPGVIYGVGLGWLVRFVAASYLARPHLTAADSAATRPVTSPIPPFEEAE